jgi:hypothetical protein
MRKRGEHTVRHSKVAIDLNREFLEPALEHIIASWHATFAANHFDKFVHSVTGALGAVFVRFTESCPDSLHRYARDQSQLCLEGRTSALEQSMPRFQGAVRGAQRRMALSFIPQIRTQLVDSYAKAGAETGLGSSVQQVVRILYAPLHE